MSHAAALDARDLTVTAPGHGRAFRVHLDALTLAPGEAAALMGRSGCGKTLMLETLALLRRPGPEGTIRIATAEDAVPLWSRRGSRGRLAAIRGAHMGVVPQTGGLLPFLSARANVALARETGGAGPDPDRVEALLDHLEIGGDVADKRPAQLSVGQRQRTAIARALVHRPAVVLADEPTGALDPELAEASMALLFEMARLERVALVVSTHDHALISRFPARRFGFEAGRGADGAVVSTMRPLTVAA